jgi:hypothetical protein
VHGGDRILAVFTSSCAINVYLTRRVGSLSSNPAHSEVYSIQHYVIKTVSDLR